MTVDPNKSSLSTDKKVQISVNEQWDENKHLQKTRRLLQSTTILYPILLALLLIIGTIFLVITITRRNTCRHLRDEHIATSFNTFSNDHALTWVPCQKTNLSSACACPATFTHSKLNPLHCLPSHSRCLHSCKHNEHCACYNLVNAQRCGEVSSHWIKHEMKIGSIEQITDSHQEKLLNHPWADHLAQEIERSVVSSERAEQVFFSADRKTAITIDIEEDDYLLNERWTKINTNTTEQHIIYTQLDPQRHTCRMSSVHANGAVERGPVHRCPGVTINAPYYIGVACQNVLVLWHGGMQSKIQRDEGWTTSRHNFESFIPRLPILLDPFHRYYSLYDDLMIEIKDLNGDVLGQWFTDIHHPTKFEFADYHGTIRIANQTHMQLITSTNQNVWLDV